VRTATVRSSPCGLFSRAEDSFKLSDDEIEDEFTSTPDSRLLYLSAMPFRSRKDGKGIGENRVDATLSVLAMRVCNPDRSPLRING
jgi:hypothetical protein